MCWSEVDIQIAWRDRKLERTCSSDQAGRRAFGNERWRKLKSRIALLEQAECLADLQMAPGKWHPLSADRAGQWSASLDGNYRLIIEPIDDPLPLFADGGLDPTRAAHVKIVEVLDYHGH